MRCAFALFGRPPGVAVHHGCQLGKRRLRVLGNQPQHPVFIGVVCLAISSVARSDSGLATGSSRPRLSFKH